MARPPKAYALGSLIELESCIGLKHSRCWNPSSKLQSPREIGVGLGQITKAFNPDGSVRFDALTELKLKHPQELREFNWQSVWTRPDLQIRAVVLKSKDNYLIYKRGDVTEYNALAFGDAAYNGGIGGLNRDRTACKISGKCDPNIWFGHVEKYCTKSKAILYGNRSACDINRHHVHEVLELRSHKYRQFWVN